MCRLARRLDGLETQVQLLNPTFTSTQFEVAILKRAVEQGKEKHPTTCLKLQKASQSNSTEGF